MEKKTPRPMIPFDELVNSPMLQMLKLFLPYTPASNQRFLGIFVKFLEFKETISFFQEPNYNLQAQDRGENRPPSPTEMLMELKPYLPPRQSEMIETFLNMLNMMEMVQMFQDMPQDTEGSPDTENAEGPNHSQNMFSGGVNPMDMVMGMLTPEQQNMFQMYNNMFSDDTFPENKNSPESSADAGDSNKTVLKEGDDVNERMDEQPGNAES